MSLESAHFRYLSSDQLFLINTLNTMYNDNHRTLQQIVYNNSVGFNNTSRIVQEIISSNNSIIDSITRTLTTVNRNNTNRLNNTQSGDNTVPQQSRNPRYFYNRDMSNNVLYNHPVFDSVYIPTGRPVSSQDRENNYRNYLNTFFTPVQIYPTQTQIETATRIVRYSDIIRPNNISCPISLEPFRDEDYVSVIRFCNHIFNTEQLNVWFQSNCRCPVCRYDIRNYSSRSINNNYHEFRSNNLNSSSINETNTDTTTDISNNNTSTDMSNNNTNTGLSNNMDRLFTSATNTLTNYLLNTDTSGNNIADLLTNEITTILLTFPYNINNTRNTSDRQI
jgi:hypothetical protein